MRIARKCPWSLEFQLAKVVVAVMEFAVELTVFEVAVYLVEGHMMKELEEVGLRALAAARQKAVQLGLE